MFKKFLVILCASLVFFGCPKEPEKTATKTATTEDIQSYETAADAVSDAISDVLTNVGFDDFNYSLKLKNELKLKSIKGLAKAGDIFAIPKDIPNFTTNFSTNFSTNVNGAEGSFSLNLSESSFFHNYPPFYMGFSINLNVNFSRYRQTGTSPLLNGNYKENGTMKSFITFSNDEPQINRITYNAKSEADIKVNNKNVKWNIDISVDAKITYGETTNMNISYSESGKINDGTYNYNYSTNIILSNLPIIP